MAGGKSRKSGGISLRLVRLIANETKNKYGSKNSSKQEKIAELIEQVNQRHHRAAGCYKKAVKHAYACGLGLLELKTLVDHGHWKEWLRRHFDGSYERARDYMKLAKEWDNPKLKEARDRGITLGIYAMLDVVRGEPLPQSKDTPETDEEKEQRECLRDNRRSLTEKFRDEITDWPEEALDLLGQYFDEWWEEIYQRVRNALKAKHKGQKRTKRTA